MHSLFLLAALHVRLKSTMQSAFSNHSSFIQLIEPQDFDTSQHSHSSRLTLIADVYAEQRAALTTN